MAAYEDLNDKDSFRIGYFSMNVVIFRVIY